MIAYDRQRSVIFEQPPQKPTPDFVRHIRELLLAHGPDKLSKYLRELEAELRRQMTAEDRQKLADLLGQHADELASGEYTSETSEIVDCATLIIDFLEGQP